MMRGLSKEARTGRVALTGIVQQQRLSSHLPARVLKQSKYHKTSCMPMEGLSRCIVVRASVEKVAVVCATDRTENQGVMKLKGSWSTNS